MTQPSYNAKQAAGLTWLEMLLTLAILALGCLALATFKNFATRENYPVDHQAIAAFLAESQLEGFKAIPFEELSETNSRLVKLNRYGGGCLEAMDEFCYTAILNINKGEPTLKSCRLMIEMRWEDGNGQHSSIFKTVITDLTF